MKASDYICDICGFGIREEDTYKLMQAKRKKLRCLEVGGKPFAYPCEFTYDLCPECAEMMKDRMDTVIHALKELQMSKQEFFKNTSKE